MDRKKVMALLLLLLVAITSVLVVKFDAYARISFQADSIDAEECELETKRPRPGTLLAVSKFSLGNSQYRYVLKVSSTTAFDKFWFLTSTDPSLVSQSAPYVFRIGNEPMTLEILSDRPSVTIGKQQESYARLHGNLQEANARHPVTGRYPLTAASVVAQLQGEYVGGSHLKSEGRWNAVDLQAPAGTGVIAFAAGKVVSVEDGYNDKLRCEYGHAPKYANVVVVLQDDGYEAIYGHLMRGSSLVREGMRVEKGASLAKLGVFTADKMGSHLHFQLGGMTDEGLVSVPVAFEDEESRPVILPQRIRNFAGDAD